jgi:hypothetical protein
MVGATAAGNGTAAPKTPSPTTSHAANAPVRSTQNDAQIERNIRARFARSKISKTETFKVTVRSGVATLEGKTNVIQHKGVATRLAKLGGAVAVDNQIEVSEAARARAAARLAKIRQQDIPKAAVVPKQ